jgi:peptide/nickel transport system substrate-binding protein
LKIPRPTRLRALLGVAAVALATAAACGTASGASGATLTVDALSPPTNLNPALSNINAADHWYTELAYAPLIHLGPGGAYQPALATSWHYVGKGNREFELTIRSGAEFSDGTAVTAEAVANSLNYSRKAAGGSAIWAADFSSVTASGNNVIIKLSSANPDMEYLMTDPVELGDIISPAGLADPSALGDATSGAGPYMLDPSQTVSGATYTYVPNPHYYDQSAIHYSQVVIKVVSNTTVALEDVQTGGADIAIGDSNTASTAKSDGLHIYAPPVAEAGIELDDRAPSKGNPIGNQLVRQALNYAINRKEISKALLRGYGQPVNQVGSPGTTDYPKSTANDYAYNPKKAKQLLKQAGYPHGFTTTMLLDTQNPPTSDIGQAVISEWAQIGVKVKAISDSNGDKFVDQIDSKKYPMVAYGYGYIPFYLYSQSFYEPVASLFNPFKSSDPVLTKLISEANNAGGAKQVKLYTEATKRVLNEAWIAPVTSYSVFYFTDSKVTNIKVDAARSLLDITEVEPAS